MVVRRYMLNAPQLKLNQQLSAIFQDMYSYLIFKVRFLSFTHACSVCGMISDFF